VTDKDPGRESMSPPRKDPPPMANPKGGGGTSWQPVSPDASFNGAAPPVAAPVSSGIKLDRIVLGGDVVVDGDFVRADKTPRGDARILFVNANSPHIRETVTTNSAGRFQITLAGGGWLIYTYSLDGETLYHSRIEVSDEQAMGRIVLVK